jgi:hypothetical protein
LVGFLVGVRFFFAAFFGAAFLAAFFFVGMLNTSDVSGSPGDRSLTSLYRTALGANHNFTLIVSRSAESPWFSAIWSSPLYAEPFEVPVITPYLPGYDFPSPCSNVPVHQ